MELGEEKGCDFDFKYRFLSKIDMMIYRLHDVVRTVSFSRDFQGNRFFLIDKRLKGTILRREIATKVVENNLLSL